MAVIQNGTRRITIRENMAIGVIEKIITSYLSQCTIWGDLHISPEEYEAHKQMATSGQPLHNPATSQQPSQFIHLDDIWSEESEELEDKADKEKDDDNNPSIASNDNDDQDGVPLNKEEIQGKIK